MCYCDELRSLKVEPHSNLGFFCIFLKHLISIYNCFPCFLSNLSDCSAISTPIVQCLVFGAFFPILFSFSFLIRSIQAMRKRNQSSTDVSVWGLFLCRIYRMKASHHWTISNLKYHHLNGLITILSLLHIFFPSFSRMLIHFCYIENHNCSNCYYKHRMNWMKQHNLLFG